MRPSGLLGNRGEGGFSLVELLMAVSILGAIGIALTSAVIFGLKTTDGTARRIFGTVASQTVASFFTADVQSAAKVWVGPDGCAVPQPGELVLVNLGWTDDGISKSVAYSLREKSPGEKDFIHWACGDSAGTPTERTLGRFSQGEGHDLVSVLCEGVACSGTLDVPTFPASVTLVTQVDDVSQPNEITVRRRSQ